MATISFMYLNEYLGYSFWQRSFLDDIAWLSRVICIDRASVNTLYIFI